jgi:hypothetical protein
MGQGVFGLAYLAALQCMPVTCTRQNYMLDNLGIEQSGFCFLFRVLMLQRRHIP